jgi:hypothetical protein
MATLRQEEFWEEHLRQTIRDAESDPEAQAWDTPSEAVWEGVSGALEEKRRRLPLLLWWGSLAAIVLLTLGGTWFVLNNQWSGRSPQTENAASRIHNNQQDNSLVEEAADLCPPVPATETSVQRHSVTEQALEETGKLIEGDLNKKVNKAIIASQLHKSTHDDLMLGNAVLPLIPLENTTNQKPSESFAAVSPLTTLEAALVSNTPEQTLFSTIPVKAQGAKIQWWAGVRSGPVYAANAVRTNRPGALLFRQQETTQWSAERGLNLTMIAPSGWYTQVGISQYSIRQNASQVFRLRFERARERQLPSGEWESTFALSVPSSFGDSEAEIDLRRDDTNALQEGQVLVVETKSTQALQYLSYSMGSGFLKSSGRWKYGAGAGIALNVLQKREFTLTAQSREMGIRSPVTRIRRSFSEASNQTTDLQLSAKLGYRVSPRWMVGVEPTLRHSLSPVVRHSSFSTAATSASLQLSVHYLL